MIRYYGQYLLIVFQVVLGIIYFSAGLSKLIAGFPHIIGPVWLIDELAKYGLGLFGYFIAVMQTVIGALLLIHRFRLIATLMLLPMHLCILIIPISLGWQGTPYVNTVFLCMILALLYADRQKLSALVNCKPWYRQAYGNKVYLVSFILTWALAVYFEYGFRQ